MGSKLTGREARIKAGLSALSAGSRVGEVHAPLHRLREALWPTVAECKRMLSDLRAVFRFHPYYLTGYTFSALAHGVKFQRLESRNPLRFQIWLAWVLVCRPGSIRTAFDLITCGRFTVHGNPARSGSSIGAKEAKLRNALKRGPTKLSCVAKATFSNSPDTCSCPVCSVARVAYNSCISVPRSEAYNRTALAIQELLDHLAEASPDEDPACFI